MQNTDKARAEFEAAAKAGSGHDMLLNFRRDARDEYMSACERAAWWAWQVSRAELVIELPKINPVEWACTGDECMAMQQGISMAGRAIRAAGVKVKE